MADTEAEVKPTRRRRRTRKTEAEAAPAETPKVVKPEHNTKVTVLPSGLKIVSR